MNPLKYFNHRSGFALLEVLIAFCVMAFGLLSIAGMLLIGQRANSSSYLKQQAVQSAYNIIDRVRSNSANAANYNANNITANGVPGAIAAAPVDCSAAACTPPQLTAYDLWYWLAKDVGQQLPNGSGSITITEPNPPALVVTATVQWDDSPAESASKLGGSTHADTATLPNLAQFSVQTSFVPAS